MSSASNHDVSDEESPTDARTSTMSMPSPRSFCLDVVGGPDAGRTVDLATLHNVRALIGKSPACDIRLTDPEVSRRHAAIDLGGARPRIVDLGSTNGTMVGDLPVVDAYLTPGSIIHLGASSLRLTTRSDRAPVVETTSPATHFGGVIGGSPQMRRLYALCERISASNVPVVIEGETGTGKEVLAEALHVASPRANGPFVVFDCTAVPGNLVESELFGHERGAFTGATTARRGMLEQAAGGTLFIDEIGDLDLALQPKLLRAVERHEMRRLGGDRTIRVDVRIIAATRRDLDREVQAGRFRDDLFHRLAVTRIELPPLRARQGDVSVFVRHFCHDLGIDPHTVPPDLLAKWEDSTWPGNIRELRNAVSRWVALGDYVAPSNDDERPSSAADAAVVALSGDFLESILALDLPLTQARQRVIDNFEKRYVERVLASNGGHVGRAAAAAGIGRRYLQMLLARER